MQAEKLILETDQYGHLIQQPKLPPNAQLEAIFLITKKNKTSRNVSKKIAGKGKIIGDIISPVISPDTWDAIK